MDAREKRKNEIANLCDEHDCAPNIRKLHFEQYVERHWHPHPPDSFMGWWRFHVDSTTHGIKASVAWNTKYYRDQYMEVRQIGAA
jgi:hypothetical protein